MGIYACNRVKGEINCSTKAQQQAKTHFFLISLTPLQCLCYLFIYFLKMEILQKTAIKMDPNENLEAGVGHHEQMSSVIT